MSVSVLLTNLVGLFLLIGVGFVAARAHWIPESASEPLTALLMKITLPMTIFSSMIRPFDPGFLKSALTIFLLGLVFHTAYVILSWPLTRLFQVPLGRRGMWMECSSFCNNGFMGFPVAYALFGDEGLSLAVALSIAFSMLVYTVGAKLIASDHQGEDGTPVSWRKVFLSPIDLAMGLGLVFYCTQIPMPQAIMTPIEYLADVTTPLSMILTGMTLAHGKLFDALRDRDAVSASFVRLLLFPVLTWAAVLLLPVSDPLVIGVLLIIMAMPSPSLSVVMAEEYGGCVELGARAVFDSSLLCIITIPLVSLLL